MAPAVETHRLVVRHGHVTAVDGTSWNAAAGEVTVLLGPNGAGKTSTVEVLEGYRRLTLLGTVRVLGLDPFTQRRALLPRIGVMLQQGGVYPGIKVGEAVRLFASYVVDPIDPVALLERVGLAGHTGRTWRHLSGGEQQRLSLALALVGRPDVAFLDEPTSGVDVTGRQVIRDVVRELARDGVTVLLTTHELDEVERLADRVVILDHGRVVADATLADLVRSGGGDEIRFGAPTGLAVGELGLALGAVVEETEPGEYRVAAASTPRTVAALTAWLADHDLPLSDLRAGRQRLEDVFLRLTQDVPASGANGPSGREREVRCAERTARAAESGRSGERSERPERPRAGSAVSAAVAPRRAAPWWRGVAAQTRVEVLLTLRRGESVLLTLGIPVLLLVFFSTVDVLPTDVEQPVDFLAPGVLALAVMSTAMVGLGIATGFERQYGVLKRLGSTPLGRPALLTAKTTAIAAVEVLQVVVLVAVALALGWDPGSGWPAAVAALGLGTVAFAGLGMLMAGTLRGEVTLAAANGLYLVLLLLGGFVVPISELPGWLQPVARGLPSGALSDLVHASIGTGHAGGEAWLVLGAWAVAAPVAAALTFRWE